MKGVNANLKEMENKNAKINERRKFLFGVVLFGFLIFFISFVSADFWACFTKGDSIDYCSELIPDRTAPTDSYKLCMRSYNESEGCYSAGVWGRCNANSSTSCVRDGNTSYDLLPPDLKVHSPADLGVYKSRGVLLNLTFNERTSIYFMDNNDPRSGWRRICSDCIVGLLKEVSFDEGVNNITILAKDRNDNEAFVTRVFYVDSKKPKISRTNPKSGFSSGNFDIKFKEPTPASLVLNFGNDSLIMQKEVNLSSCIIERKDTFCEVYADVSYFDGGEIEYWFNLTDIAGSYDLSKKMNLDVDVTPPVINEVNYTVDSKYVYFRIDVTESYLDEVGYSYVDYKGKYKEVKLCTKLDNGICNAKVTFVDGPHNLTIYAIDDAGQMVGGSVSFFSDSKKPKIRKVFPARGLVSGEFSVEIDEANLDLVELYYSKKGVLLKDIKTLDIGNDCELVGNYYVCTTNVNLSEYHAQDVEFYFVVKDKVNNIVTGKVYSLEVDSVFPKLLNPGDYSYQGTGRDERYVYFEMQIEESNFDGAYYYDLLDPRAKWKKICSRLVNGVCVGKGSFSEGEHSIDVKIVDDAGNEIYAPQMNFSYYR